MFVAAENRYISVFASINNYLLTFCFSVACTPYSYYVVNKFNNKNHIVKHFRYFNNISSFQHSFFSNSIMTPGPGYISFS